MTELLYWDVDTQVDFMRPDGRLYVPDSESIVPALQALTDHAHAHDVPIVASADEHVAGHRELSDAPDFRETFPPHCMRGTPGQRKIAETALRDPLVIPPEPADPASLARRIAAHRGDFLLLKHWFDVFTNPNTVTLLHALRPRRIVLYGVALDVCDRYAVEGILARWPAAELTLVTDAARAIDPVAGARLLRAWAAQGVRMATAEDVVGQPV